MRIVILLWAQWAATATTNVSVVDVTSGRLLAGQTVVVTGNRITELGPAGRVKVPAPARTIDGTGKYLIPGLWDIHVHAATPWFGNYFMPLLVAHGITGVREMFSATQAVDVWRQRIGSGQAVGPRVGLFGSLVDGSPPIWPRARRKHRAPECPPRAPARQTAH